MLHQMEKVWTLKLLEHDTEAVFMGDVGSDDFVGFVGPGARVDSAPPGAEQDYGAVRDFFQRSKQEVAAEWDLMCDQLEDLVARVSVSDANFQLRTVEFE